MLKLFKTILWSSVICAGTVHLSGCGQSGPLYLPKDKPFATVLMPVQPVHGAWAIATPGMA
jgi:predicted small lipoprotein YifL